MAVVVGVVVEGVVVDVLVVVVDVVVIKVSQYLPVYSENKIGIKCMNLDSFQWNSGVGIWRKVRENIA